MTKKKGPPLRDREATKKRIEKELKGEVHKPNKCPPHTNITYQTNRKGEQYHECSDCGAFLGWG